MKSSFKTSSIRESEGVTPRNLETLLQFIPLLEAPSFCPDRTIPVYEDGQTEEDFQKLVTQLMDACYKNGFVVRFDWEKWDTEALTLVRNPDAVGSADFDTVRRLLTWHVRQNRFNRTHFAGMIASGHILAILLRLKSIGQGNTSSG